MKLLNYGSAKLVLYQHFRNLVLVIVLTPRLTLTFKTVSEFPVANKSTVVWLASKSIVSQNSNEVAKFCFSGLTISENS